MNSLKQLGDFGQSIWLDYIRRDLITSGEFQRLVEDDGVHGVTSNPTIFDKAIAAGSDYDDALRLLLAADPDSDALTLFETLEIEDLQMAADILRPVYDQTKGADGFVSIEVSPRLAYDTAGSIAEAQRLWKAVNRPNLMVKIPSTVPGVQAVEVLIAEGININITLMFSLAHYEAVAQAYLRGLKRNAKPTKSRQLPLSLSAAWIRKWTGRWRRSDLQRHCHYAERSQLRMPGWYIDAFAKSFWELPSRNTDVEERGSSVHYGPVPEPRTQLSRMFYTSRS
jgi:hypothetical protein